MMRNAFLFPGQGAQYVGMGKEFFDAFATARWTFEEADNLLSMHLSRTVFEGPENILQETRNSQCAIFVASVAILRVIQEQFPNLKIAATAGLSLGEYSALYAGGFLLFDQGLKLVQLRANAMDQACRMHQGVMSAVLGLESKKIEELVLEAARSQEKIWVANYNSSDQTVISGSPDSITRITPKLIEQGARRVLPLKVHGAFHSGLMQSAQEICQPAIEQTSFKQGICPIIMNVTGKKTSAAEEIKKNLIEQITGSVRWQQTVQQLIEEDTSLYLEIGCGSVLTGLNRRIGVKKTSLVIERVTQLEELSHHLETSSCCY